MTKLIETLITNYNAECVVENVVRFTIGDDDYVYFGDTSTLYGEVDGELLPGASTVKTVKSLEKFIALRA